MARRIRRLFRGGRIIDVGGGHGLLAHALMLLDDSSPMAFVIDKTVPPSSDKVHQALVEAWPRLSGRIGAAAMPLEAFELLRTDLVVSSHACGDLTDDVLERASAARARVAVLPCCHDLAACDSGELAGWVAGDLAIDLVRAFRLRQQGYRIWTQAIPPDITPMNRLLLGAPERSDLPHH